MENDIAFWIREVRGEMTQVEFAKCVYHYEISASVIRIAKGYHLFELEL